MPWALVAVLAAGGMLAFDVMRLRRGLGLVALGCFSGLALWSGLSVLWAWLPGEAATEASRALFYAAAFAIVLLAVRTQRDAATMVGLIAAATGLVTLYGCVRLAQSSAGVDDDLRPPGLADRLSEHVRRARRARVLESRRRRRRARISPGPRARWRSPRPSPALGFAVLTQSRGAAVTLILVSPFAIALVRERLRLTAFLLVGLAGLLPALPALRTAIDAGTAASAGTAAGRLLLGGVLVGTPRRAPIAVADQRSRSRRRGGASLGRGAAGAAAVGALLRRRRGAAAGRAGAPQQRLALVHAGRRRRASRARTCSRSNPTAGTSGRSRPTISLRGR